MYRYYGFISYSHRDSGWGGWLHKRLETWRVPRPLVGQQGQHGAIQARAFPVFRDREELPGSSDLGSNIEAALQDSRFLIALCSPNSAASFWCNEEIRYYIDNGRAEQVVALITAGEPDSESPERECLPPILRESVSGVRVIDARTQRDDAVLDLLAILHGCDSEILRYRSARRTKARRFSAGLALVAGLSAVGLGIDHVRELQNQQRVSENRTVANQSMEALEAGDPGKALNLAMSVSPGLSDLPAQPWLPEIEQALLSAALMVEPVREIAKLPHYIDWYQVSPDGESILVYANAALHTIDLKTGETRILERQTDSGEGWSYSQFQASWMQNGNGIVAIDGLRHPTLEGELALGYWRWRRNGNRWESVESGLADADTFPLHTREGNGLGGSLSAADVFLTQNANGGLNVRSVSDNQLKSTLSELPAGIYRLEDYRAGLFLVSNRGQLYLIDSLEGRVAGSIETGHEEVFDARLVDASSVIEQSGPPREPRPLRLWQLDDNKPEVVDTLTGLIMRDLVRSKAPGQFLALTKDGPFTSGSLLNLRVADDKLISRVLRDDSRDVEFIDHTDGEFFSRETAHGFMVCTTHDMNCGRLITDSGLADPQLLLNSQQAVSVDNKTLLHWPLIRPGVSSVKTGAFPDVYPGRNSVWPNGRNLVMVNEDGAVRTIDVSNGRLDITLPAAGHEDRQFYGVEGGEHLKLRTFSDPDGEKLQLLNASGRLVLETDAVSGKFQLSPGGDWLVAADADNRFVVYDTGSGERLERTEQSWAAIPDEPSWLNPAISADGELMMALPSWGAPHFKGRGDAVWTELTMACDGSASSARFTDEKKVLVANSCGELLLYQLPQTEPQAHWRASRTDNFNARLSQRAGKHILVPVEYSSTDEVLVINPDKQDDACRANIPHRSGLKIKAVSGPLALVESDERGGGRMINLNDCSAPMKFDCTSGSGARQLQPIPGREWLLESTLDDSCLWNLNTGQVMARYSHSAALFPPVFVDPISSFAILEKDEPVVSIHQLPRDRDALVNYVRALTSSWQGRTDNRIQ